MTSLPSLASHLLLLHSVGYLRDYDIPGYLICHNVVLSGSLKLLNTGSHMVADILNSPDHGILTGIVEPEFWRRHFSFIISLRTS